MKSMLRALLAVVLLLSLQTGFSQNRCGSTAYLHAQMQADTGLARRMQQIEQFTSAYVAAHPQGSGSRAVITIPVVFHVLYNTAAQNIADSFCIAQIAQLNLDYARLNTDAANTPAPFAAVAANTNIQFCLAVRDPNGAATTGIIHKATTVTSFSTNDAAKYSAQGGDNAWPAASYLNIWSCNLGGGLLGYSQFPGGAAATDGCVILYNSIGSMLRPTTATPYNLGRTVTHEVGHWLNLYHIWGDDGGACTGSDNCADTPNQGSENYGCPTYPLTDNCTATSPGVMFMNYMDYVDDGCMNMFSQNQAQRMQANFASGGARTGILSSQGCVSVGPPCAVATGLTTTAITSTSATYSWAAVTGASSYVLQYRVVGTTTWTSVTVSGLTYTINGLTPNTNYEWQVETKCSNSGTSLFSGSATFVTAGPPVAKFGANVLTSCTGIINFTDSSTGTPTQWSWNFGDGTFSTLQNPQHEYFTNGTFTVALTASNTYGTNTATKTNYITVNKPAAPTATGGSHCGPGSVTLSSTATDTIKWYANATDVTPVSVSNPFVTPSLSTTTTYYAEEITAGPVSEVGPVANTTLGSGGYFSNATSQYEIFSTYAPCTLVSVLVYAQAAGARVIALRDSAGNVLQSYNATLAAGANTVTLNFVLPVANNLQLGITGTANLYRNNAVTTGYPFTLPGLVSITTSSAGTGYYYFLYNWQIKGGTCTSLRAPVVATITAGLTTNVSTTNVSCYGATTGSSTLNVSGGSPAYTYLWSNGQTTATLSNVGQGTYTVTVSDAASCSGTQSVSISQPTQLLLNATITNATCGLNNGSATAVTSGGSPSYTFHWNNNATSSAISNLSAGTYTVTVTDNHNCSVSTSAAIITSGSLNLSTTNNGVSCFGANDAVISVSASGGTPAYTYLWAGGQTGYQLSNLGTGTYSVTASDASGCSASQTITVTQPAQLQVVTRVTNASCGQSNGSVTTSVAGGTPNYAYAWDNGSTASAINNLSSGTYNVTVTDNKGCQASASATVINTGALSLTTSQGDAQCYGSANGTAGVSATGGSPAYTYVWSNGVSAQTISNLTAGNYIVTVTDAGSCTSTASVSISQPTQINITSHTTQPLCSGSSNGSIFVTANGGAGSYSYVWSNTATGSTISNIPAGNYTVTVTDASNCTTSGTINLSGTQPFSTSFSTINVVCNGQANGSTTLTVVGGTPGYSYSWNNGNTTSNISNLAAGTYLVTITDANNCSSTSSVIISQPAAIGITTTSTASVTGQSNGTATVQTVTGAVSPYTVNWSTGDSTLTASNLAGGTYTVTLTDANGCQQTATVTVSVIMGVGAVNTDINFNVFPNPATTQLNLSFDNLKENGTISIINTLGQKVSEEQVKQNTESVTIDVSKLATGVYVLELRSGNDRSLKQVVISR